MTATHLVVAGQAAAVVFLPKVGSKVMKTQGSHRFALCVIGPGILEKTPCAFQRGSCDVISDSIHRRLIDGLGGTCLSHSVRGEWLTCPAHINVLEVGYISPTWCGQALAVGSSEPAQSKSPTHRGPTPCLMAVPSGTSGSCISTLSD